MTNRADIKIWKIDFSESISPEEIEMAVFEAARSIQTPDFVEIIRVDNFKNETRVFFAGDQDLAERLTKTLMLRSPKAKSQYTTAKSEELFQFPE